MRHLIGRRSKSNLMKRRIHIWPWCNGAITMHYACWFTFNYYIRREVVLISTAPFCQNRANSCAAPLQWSTDIYEWYFHQFHVACGHTGVTTMTYSVGDYTNINSLYTDSKHLLLKSGASQIVAWFLFCMQYSSVDFFKVFTVNMSYVYVYVSILVSH